MHAGCITVYEVTFLARAGSLVQTHETVVISEVDVPMLLDLLEFCVPAVTVSRPVEKNLLPAEVRDHPRIEAFVIAASGSVINATTVVTVIEDVAVSAELQNWHWSDILNHRFGSRGIIVFLIPFGDTERWGEGT